MNSFYVNRPGKVSIAKIKITYDNMEILNMLKVRGAAIKAADWDKVKQVNTEIDDYKNANYEKLVTPITCIITMETEEGYQRALVIDTKKIPIYSEVADTVEAPEPSDIIWENRRIHPNTRLFRSIVTTIVVFILFAGSFVLITALKKEYKALQQKYPTTNCTVIESLYNQDEMLHYAVDNYWDYYYPAEGVTPLSSLPSQFSCFCSDQFTTLGVDVVDTNFTYGSKTAPICS